MNPATALCGTTSHLLEATRRLRGAGTPGHLLRELYETLSELAAVLEVRSVIVAVDDERLGRQVLRSDRLPLTDAESVGCLSGPPGIVTLPRTSLDESAVGELVAAAGSVLARATRIDLVAATPRSAPVAFTGDSRDEVVRGIEPALARATRYGWEFTLILMRFEVEDASAMTTVMNRTRNRLRAGDMLQTYGRDGLALVLPAAPGDHVPQILHRLSAGGPPLRFGLASCPVEARDAASLVELAEERLNHVRGVRPSRT